MTDEPRIKIALQKKGRLFDDSASLLKSCGLHINISKDQLFCRVREMPIDILFVRDDDIPLLVETDKCDLGIVGRNLLTEYSCENPGSAGAIEEIMPLDFAQCTLSIAVPNGRTYNGPKDLEGLRIATSYPAILADFLKRNSINAEIVYLSGAVEIAPRVKIADVIFDLVSSGATLAANNMRAVESVLESEALLVRTARRLDDRLEEIISRLRKRIEGVIRAQNSKYVMLNCRRDAAERIAKLIPGAAAPSIMNLADPDMVAMHAVCNEEVFWETMEEIRAAGATGILVVGIEKMMG